MIKEVSFSKLHYIWKYLNHLFCNSFLKCLDGKFYILNVGDVKEVYFTNDRHVIKILEEVSELKPVMLGLFIGWIKKNKNFIPSPNLLKHLYDCLGVIKGAAVVSSQGVKAFLYGNDILLESIVKVYKPIKKALYVAIIDAADSEIIGIGKSNYDYENLIKLMKENKKNKNVEVFKNVFDLGRFLRKENTILD